MKKLLYLHVIPVSLYLIYIATFLYISILNFSEMNKIDTHSEWAILKLSVYIFGQFLLFHSLEFNLNYVTVFKEYLRRRNKYPKNTSEQRSIIALKKPMIWYIVLVAIIISAIFSII